MRDLESMRVIFRQRSGSKDAIDGGDGSRGRLRGVELLARMAAAKVRCGGRHYGFLEFYGMLDEMRLCQFPATPKAGPRVAIQNAGSAPSDDEEDEKVDREYSIT